MMEKEYSGRVWKFGKNISTDNIAPSRLFAHRANMEEFASKYCLIDAREDFVTGVRPGDIIVADTNFGCGSSREIAPTIIKMCGVPVVIAKSFGRIFYRNAINIGLILIESDTSAFTDGEKITVNLEERIIYRENDPAYKLSFFLSDKELRLLQEGGLLNFIEKYHTLDI